MMADIPIPLVEQVEADRCVVFVGPDASLPAKDRVGPPGTAMLAGELALRLGRQLAYYALPWVAQVYADSMGNHALLDYVATRLDDPRYRPTPVHHLIAQLPFRLLIYTAQDMLLRQALQQHRIPVNYVQQGESLSYISGRTVIQPYGTAAQPDTLRLTEDARRRVFDDNSELARFLRDRAGTHSLLFLGYTLDDPYFREFYHDLRPQMEPHTPRAYLIQAGGGADDQGYWQGHNASVLQTDLQTFLQSLADVLARRGQVPIALEAWRDEPPLLTADEQAQRAITFTALSRQVGTGGPVESGMQLQPVANSLAFVRRVGEEMAGQPGHLNEEAADLPAQVLLQRGNAAWAEGNRPQAREFFEQAVDRSPELIDASFSLYHLLVESGELAEALGVYRQILARAPGRAFLPKRYQILQILGQSEIGITYCVLDLEQQQTVAITLLRRVLALHGEVAERFSAEMAPVVSKRISRVLGFDRYRLRSYLITELVEGPSLQSRLHAGPLPLPEAWRIADEVAEALEDGAGQGVPHLALMPANIMLSTGGVKLVSYGFSRLVNAWFTAAGIVAPRTDYQSPEQRAGEAGDGRSDIYALGTILYEMLAGRPPGVGAFEEVSQVRPQVDEAVDLLVARARDVQPHRRFQSITEMRKEIQRLSLATQSGMAGQRLRLALSKLSDLYAYLVSPHGLLIVLCLLAAAGVAEAWPPLAGLRGLTRGFGMLLVYSLITSVITYYVVRETARRRGLGSLIRSGRGMGASLGWWLTFLTLRATNWWPYSGLAEVRFARFAPYTVAVLALILVMFGLCLLLIALIAGLSGKWWRRYVWGFYGSYLAISVFLVVAAAFHLQQLNLIAVG